MWALPFKFNETDACVRIIVIKCPGGKILCAQVADAPHELVEQPIEQLPFGVKLIDGRIRYYAMHSEAFGHGSMQHWP